jgi:hypothetical protein
MKEIIRTRGMIEKRSAGVVPVGARPPGVVTVTPNRLAFFTGFRV